MANFNGSKVDGNTVGASEWNQLASINNLITTSGQTLSTSNLEQSAISSARYSSAGNFFTDSGTANSYILTPVAPFKSPVSSAAGEGYFVGMIIRFKAGNACSGASTVNVNNAGSKSLKKSDGATNLTSGDILTNTEVEFVYDGTNFVQSSGKISASSTTRGLAFLSNPITISNNATDANNDIDFSSGNFQFSDGSGQVAAAAITKRLDAAWVAGNNNGGLLAGTKAINSTYHCFKIYNATTGVEDSAFLLGVSGVAPNPTAVLPAGFTKFKRIASILTDASGNIRTGKYSFFLNGYEFTYTNEILDASSNISTTKVALTITVPLGIQTKAVFYTIVHNVDHAFDRIFFFEGGTSICNSSFSGGGFGISQFGTTLNCKTNLSKQIDWKTQNYTILVSLTTLGFIDHTN